MSTQPTDWWDRYAEYIEKDLDGKGLRLKTPDGYFHFLAASVEDYSRERQEKGAAVLSALLDAHDATEAKRKAMHAARQKPRGGYRNKK